MFYLSFFSVVFNFSTFYNLNSEKRVGAVKTCEGLSTLSHPGCYGTGEWCCRLVQSQSKQRLRFQHFWIVSRLCACVFLSRVIEKDSKATQRSPTTTKCENRTCCGFSLISILDFLFLLRFAFASSITFIRIYHFPIYFQDNQEWWWNSNRSIIPSDPIRFDSIRQTATMNTINGNELGRWGISHKAIKCKIVHNWIDAMMIKTRHDLNHI